MTLQDQVDALLALQGGSAIEDDLLQSAVLAYGGSTTSPGVNDTRIVLLDSGTRAFHKPFAGINTQVALAFGHHPDQVPINECAAWRLAVALGGTFPNLVAPCVIWSYQGEAGALTRGLEGVSATADPLGQVPDQCRAAAFFDALVAQQDRHFGNLRWDASSQRLGLYDHGYAFCMPGHRANAAVFVDWRWQTGEEALDQQELDAADLVTSDPDVLGLRSFLLPDRADALYDRARRMQKRGTLLRAGEF
jgi:hypothetical protein